MSCHQNIFSVGHYHGLSCVLPTFVCGDPKPQSDCIWRYGLVLLRLLKQNALSGVAYKQQTFTSHSSGGWLSEIRVPVRCVPLRALSPVAGCRLLMCPRMAERELASFLVSSYKDINPIDEDPTLRA